MAGSWEFRPDTAGIQELLRSQAMGRLVGDVAAQIAQSAAGRFTEATYLVERYRTDRQAAGAVVVGRNVVSEEIQNGYLAAAARSAGLDFKSRRRGR